MFQPSFKDMLQIQTKAPSKTIFMFTDFLKVCKQNRKIFVNFACIYEEHR